MPLDSELPIESIRRRPAMYIGATHGFFGFIHYLVSAYDLLFEHRPAEITTEVSTDGLRLESDAVIPITADPNGLLIPFEQFPPRSDGSANPNPGLAGPVLAALSDELTVETGSPSDRRSIRFERGRRTAAEPIPATGRNGTILRFRIDSTILTSPPVSLANFTSYLRRMSYLHPRTRFRLRIKGVESQFHAPGGMRDLFDAVAAPFQYLHEPIHIRAEQGDLQLEAVFAWQSWHENRLWAFVNRGRAALGGTHETGFQSALHFLYRKLGLPNSEPERKAARNGVLAVMSVIYPGVTREGCIKAKVHNPELRSRVRKVVVNETLAWIRTRPDVAEQLRSLQTFVFPESWK